MSRGSILETLTKRLNHIQENQKELWRMQTPSRVEGLPSPPYIVMKAEENDKIN